MGCDIHIMAEKRISENSNWVRICSVFPLGEYDKKYYKKDFGDSPFDNRNYGTFAFLADVRNYSHCECLTKEPKGIPDDACPEFLETCERWDGDGHSHSYISVAEFLSFDYDKVFWNRRVTKQISPNCFNGASLAEEGEGTHETYREYLGEHFFTGLEILKQQGEPENVRVVFFFDN